MAQNDHGPGPDGHLVGVPGVVVGVPGQDEDENDAPVVKDKIRERKKTFVFIFQLLFWKYLN